MNKGYLNAKRNCISTNVILFVLLIAQCFFTNSIKAQHPGDVNLLIADKKFIRADYMGAAAIYKKHLSKHEGDFYTTRQIAVCYSRVYDHDQAIDYWTPIYTHAKASDQDRMEYAKCLLANYRNEEATRVFNELKNSRDPIVMAWSNAYSNPKFFTEDASLLHIIPVTGFSSDEHEANPVIYKSELIYITDKDKNFLQKIFDFKKKKSQIFSAVKVDSVTWQKGKIFNPIIQRDKVNGSVAFTPDDSVMYFTGCYSSKEMKKAGYGHGASLLRILFTEINTYGVAHPEVQPFIHNSSSYNTAYPFIDKSGTKLYFASDMPGTLGGYDIWVCEKINGTWGPPKNLGPHINSGGNEICPHLSNEGILYFSSDGKPGMGGLDIFFADPSGDESIFIEAENAVLV
ncbi:MAG: PD40 domain-containing protein [Sphingobacteriaceae bacterium]|nr:PD40 domain-containing protein [Sphingobacteriaceae bacterium]